MRKTIFVYLIFASIVKSFCGSNKYVFPIVSDKKAAVIYFDINDYKVVGISSELLANDIESITGIKPEIKSSKKICDQYVIIIGTLNKSRYINDFIKKRLIDTSGLTNKWESFCIQTINNPSKNIRQALLIIGSDRRGTAFGVFELSKQLGISPWYFWADIKPEKKGELFINQCRYYFPSPSVKYRGIFLNDEDWGLQPWAAKTYEPETGDIGPKTYAKIFELLLRLKANTIWPAMHDCTKAFYYYNDNPRIADDYAIVIGTSHAEPMLRNNVFEWDTKKMGEYNYFTNRDSVYKYWETRVKESKNYECIYTLGMRGIHDSKMLGSSSIDETTGMLEKIINDQRIILSANISKNIKEIPQAITLYKEVLDIYNNGLKVPDDVTIIWPDDNYGYIAMLPNNEEQKRTGGSGIYYHASYWGRPHDYLWLSTTHPLLIFEEMKKAYEMKTDKIWILNVGDIKPVEYIMTLFLDMAYNINNFLNEQSVINHLSNFYSDIFGIETGKIVSEVYQKYYSLAYERRPEFMGWSQTEPLTDTRLTAFNNFLYGDEAQKRIDNYDNIEKTIINIAQNITIDKHDAFYQLVYYPIVCASLMNKKFLYFDKAVRYANQNRICAIDLWNKSYQSFNNIKIETEYYNNKMSGGKWKYMMSMNPRNLNVFKEPKIINFDKNQKKWDCIAEGYNNCDSAYNLPIFYAHDTSQYFIDLFLTDSIDISWSALVTETWINVSENIGVLRPVANENQKRLWVKIDHSKIKNDLINKGYIYIKANGKEKKITVTLDNSIKKELNGFNGFIEKNGYISIYASNYNRLINSEKRFWEKFEGLGRTGSIMIAKPNNYETKDKSDTNFAETPVIEYDFYTFSDSVFDIYINCIPFHPVTGRNEAKLAISIDDKIPQIINLRTYGRSEEWKQNVLENRAAKRIPIEGIKKGKHILKIYMIDPGVAIDYILINTGGLKNLYSIIPETKYYN